MRIQNSKSVASAVPEIPVRGLTDRTSTQPDFICLLHLSNGRAWRHKAAGERVLAIRMYQKGRLNAVLICKYRLLDHCVADSRQCGKTR